MGCRKTYVLTPSYPTPSQVTQSHITLHPHTSHPHTSLYHTHTHTHTHAHFTSHTSHYTHTPHTSLYHTHTHTHTHTHPHTHTHAHTHTHTHTHTHISPLTPHTLTQALKSYPGVDPATVTPPWCMSVHTQGHSFPHGTETFHPRVEFESKRVVFPASGSGERVYRSMTVWNHGDTPALFEFSPDPNE